VSYAVSSLIEQIDKPIDEAKSGDLKNLMHKAAGPNPRSQRSPTPKADDLARAMRIELKDGAELPSPIDRDGADSDDSDDALNVC
jgi:hypothetical protein